jgi:hypothetical protein
VLEWLETTSYSEWVTASWGWPFALTLHAFGSAIVAGLMFIIGLRLFGFFRTIPYTSLEKLAPYVWAGVVCQFYSGLTLWMSKPPKYVRDWVFDTKFTLVVIGIIFTVMFLKTLRLEATQWQATGAVSSTGLKRCGAACATWAFVIIMGRLTAYLGNLYGGV